MSIQGITVVIPCLNEAETIAAAVEEALEGIRLSGQNGEVVVADNGSTDGSIELAVRAGARIVRVPIRGYGAALHHGLLSAQYSMCVFADADLSYPFIEIPKLIGPLVRGDAQFVLGSRLQGSIEQGSMPLLNRYIGTPILSLLIRTLYRLPISDCNSGMRAFKTDIYRGLQLCCPGMEYASEMIIRVAESRLKYSEVKINFRRDRRNRAPHLRRWRDGWRHLRFILGNSPSMALIVTPGLVGGLFLLIAFLISFQHYFLPTSDIHYHTAFILIMLAGPLSLFSSMALIIKASRHNAKLSQSRLIHLLHQFSENSAPFYISMIFFAFAGFELIRMAWIWRLNSFTYLAELPSVIRFSVFSTVGTAIFSLDMGLGLLRILPFRDEL